MTEKNIQELEIIKEAIRNHVPKLAEFIDCKIPIEEYSANLYKNDVDDVYISRQNIIKESIKKQCLDLFGEESKNFRLNLDGPVVANMVDHNGILNNPILLSSHFITSASNLFDSKFDILSLNTGLYPLNNPFYKRGLGYQGETITFISKSKSHQLVYYSPPLEFPDFPQDIKEILQEADFGTNEYAWEQASKMNYKLWPLLFQEELRLSLPKLITLNQDEVVSDLLKDAISKKQGFVYDTMFNPEFRKMVKKEFMDTTGAWSKDGGGSFLFWARDDRNQAVAMHQDGDYLVSSKESFDYKIKIQEEEILEALENKKIYAGMVLLFGAFLFHTGMVPLAGYGSINYLNVMKNRWLNILKDTYPDEHKGIEKMNINKLVGGPVLTYYRDDKKQIQPAYMLDILMSGGLSKDYLKNIFSMNFNDLLLPAFVDIYNTYVPQEKRKPISITQNDIVSEQLTWLK